MAQIPIKMYGSSGGGRKQPPNYRLIYHLGNEFANPTEEESRYAIATGGWTAGYKISSDNQATLSYVKTNNNISDGAMIQESFYGAFMYRTWFYDDYYSSGIQMTGGDNYNSSYGGVIWNPIYCYNYRSSGGSGSGTTIGFLYQQIVSTFSSAYPVYVATGIWRQTSLAPSQTKNSNNLYTSANYNGSPKTQLTAYAVGFYNLDDITYLTQQGYGNTEADIVSNINTTSLITGKKLFEDEKAVKYLINYCTGSLMITGLANATFVSAMKNSSYYTLIQADEDWSKFLSLV